MKKFALLAVGLLLAPVAAHAQRAPDTVFLQDLTWDEVRDALAAGKTSIIIATAGTEQNGPHLVLGKHKFVLQYTMDRLAREVGNTLVAPIIPYTPEGSWENPRGSMAKAGTITLPNDRFMTLLEHAAKSFKGSGFKDILLIGDSGGNQDGLMQVAAKLNQEWAGSGVRAHFIGDYYEKAHDEIDAYLTKEKRIPQEKIGGHAGVVGTSQLLFVNPAHVRTDRVAPEGGFPDSGASGDPTLATREIGERILAIKIRNGAAQIRSSLANR
jgi:creatinine amidohydrolase